jgi:hypothetical protein
VVTWREGDDDYGIVRHTVRVTRYELRPEGMRTI